MVGQYELRYKGMTIKLTGNLSQGTLLDRKDWSKIFQTVKAKKKKKSAQGNVPSKISLEE